MSPTRRVANLPALGAPTVEPRQWPSAGCWRRENARDELTNAKYTMWSSLQLDPIVDSVSPSRSTSPLPDRRASTQEQLRSMHNSPGFAEIMKLATLPSDSQPLSSQNQAEARSTQEVFSLRLLTERSPPPPGLNRRPRTATSRTPRAAGMAYGPRMLDEAKGARTTAHVLRESRSLPLMRPPERRRGAAASEQTTVGQARGPTQRAGPTRTPRSGPAGALTSGIAAGLIRPPPMRGLSPASGVPGGAANRPASPTLQLQDAISSTAISSWQTESFQQRARPFSSPSIRFIK